MKKVFDFKYGEDWYTSQGAETFARENLKAMKAEYSRMRDVAQKRISRLGGAYGESKTYQEKAQGFPKISEIAPENFAKAFSDLAKFVKAKTSTVTGQSQRMRKTMSTLNKAIGAGEGGQVGVTKQNYWRVIKILEETRRRKLTYGSDKIVTLAESTMPLSSDQFDELMDNLNLALEHADDFAGSLEDYMQDNDIKDFQIVDVDDFISDIGW